MKVLKSLTFGVIGGITEPRPGDEWMVARR